MVRYTRNKVKTTSSLLIDPVVTLTCLARLTFPPYAQINNPPSTVIALLRHKMPIIISTWISLMPGHQRCPLLSPRPYCHGHSHGGQVIIPVPVCQSLRKAAQKILWLPNKHKAHFETARVNQSSRDGGVSGRGWRRREAVSE